MVNDPSDPKSMIPKAPDSLGLPRHAWIYPALLIVTFAVYFQVSHFGFLNYDDNEYILKNPVVRSGLTPAGLVWAFTTGYAANWFPLTWISHMADCEIFGLHAGWHHLTNVFLHALAAMLLFAFLERATSTFWQSAFVALVFVLHPLHVESVAWVAERKDVLSAIFWFLSLLAYVRYAERTTAARYWLVFVCFALGLMAKPMIVTLPFVLLLLDIWPLRRPLPMARRIREKLPLFALSAVVSVITFNVQRAGGAVKALSSFPLGSRLENALLSYIWYIEKTVWPSRPGGPLPLSTADIGVAGGRRWRGSGCYYGAGRPRASFAPAPGGGLVLVLGNPRAGDRAGAGGFAGARRPLRLHPDGRAHRHAGMVLAGQPGYGSRGRRGMSVFRRLDLGTVGILAE